MSIKTKKERWRQVYREKRRRVFPKNRNHASSSLVENLASWERLADLKRILFYYPVGKEISPLGLAQSNCHENHLIFYFPRISEDRSELELYEVTDFSTQCRRGSYGIMEPVPDKTRQAAIEEIDLVLVPGVVFARNGVRIGRGAGFYDKFLTVALTAVSVGLGYDFQLVPELPREKHDQPVDYFCSELGLRQLAKVPT